MLNFLYTHCKTLLLIFCSVIFLSSCDDVSPDMSQLDKIKQRGFLRVGLLNSNRSYFIGPEGPDGLDYEIATRFAQYLGVKLEVHPAYTIEGLLPALDDGEIDIIATAVTATEMDQSEKKYQFGPAYYATTQQLVYKNGRWHPRKFAEILKKDVSIGVPAHSIYEQTLTRLQNALPDLKWKSINGQNTESILLAVANGELDFTVADSIDVALTQQTDPDIAVALDLTEDQDATWLLKKEQDNSLYALVVEFFGQEKQSGEIDRLEAKYFSHLKSFDYVETRTFLRALDKVLPQWQNLFMQHADTLDWRLIAAVAYQESHWNPRATSPTGVRGMMMLTQNTAKMMGVTNRLNAQQSIKGGVKYLTQLIERLPKTIHEDEKIWFALGSYNLGFGHILDARKIVKYNGKDENVWSNVSQVLPLLMKPQYYKNTRYGYARGSEAVAYVKNIKRYYQSILKQQRKSIANINPNGDAGAINNTHDVDNLENIDVNLTTDPQLSKTQTIEANAESVIENTDLAVKETELNNGEQLEIENKITQ